jgi:hypothetical protein
MLSEIMATQCANRTLHALVAAVPFLSVGRSANNKPSAVSSRYFHENNNLE